jgi:hypothetical protein
MLMLKVAPIIYLTILALVSNCDHCIVTCNLNLTVPKRIGHTRFVWNFRRADSEGLNAALAGLPWGYIFQQYSVDDQARIFTENVLNACKIFIPSNIITVNPKDKPWCNNKLKQLIKKRNRAFSRYQRTKRPDHFDIYRSLRNLTLAENRRLKVKYDNDIQSSPSNAKNKNSNFWHLARPN